MNTPLFSIIIPIYNTQEYLNACIESIISQEFKDYELLLINDGSTDGCLDICNHYKNKHQNIIVADLINQGVSAARNIGIEMATGKYLIFVDSDDMIFPNSLKKIADSIRRTDYEIVVLNSWIINKRKEALAEIYRFPQKKTKQIRSGVELFKFYTRGSVCGAIFLTELVKYNNIRFNTSMKNGEDSLFFSLCQIYAQFTIHFPIDLYLINVREGSASRSISLERIKLQLCNLHIIRQELNNRSLNSSQKAILNFLIYRFISISLNSYDKISYLKRYKEIKSIIYKNDLLPIPLEGIYSLKKKIIILNLSLDLYYFLLIINNRIRSFTSVPLKLGRY